MQKENILQEIRFFRFDNGFHETEEVETVRYVMKKR